MTDKPESADEGATNFLAVVPEHKPELVLLDEKARAVLFDHIEKEMKEKTFDLTTQAGRDECRSFAAKITKTKTALTATAMALTEAWRKNTAEVNKQRKPVEERLAELAKQARQPLTDWEEAEAKRTAIIEATIAGLNKDAEVSIEATAADIEARIARVEAMTFDEAIFKGALQSAQESQIRTLNFLRPVLERLQKAEADAKRLAELEAEAETRRLADEARAAEEKRKADEAAAAERAAKQNREYAESIMDHIRQVGLGMIGGKTYPYPILLRELEEKIPPEITERFGDLEAPARQLLAETLASVRAAFDKSMAEAQERAAKDQEEAAKRAAAEAADNARRESEQAAAERAADAQRAADEALAAEKQRAADAEARSLQVQMEREAADKAREDALAAERARREKAERDEEHRTKCKREAKLALMTIPGVTEAIARDIVVLILAEEVPRTTLDFAAEPRVSARQAFEEAREEAPDAEAAEHVAELPL